jgi:UDP-glucuronate 4-epimerase
MEMITSLESAIGRKANMIMKPMQPGDVTATYADVSKLKALCGFEAKTQLPEGLARFAAWYKDYVGAR